MADSPLTPAALRHRRETTIATLCEHFARDNLEVDELERLIDRAHQAVTIADLDALVAGLPALQPSPDAGPPAAATPSSRPQHQIVAAVLGGAERKGTWTPARNIHVTAVLGGIVLDFTEARLGAGVTEINVLAVMGGVEITVAPGTRVESNGIGIMGGFDHRGVRYDSAKPGAPILRVGGIALMGGVEIKQAEPPMGARLRHRPDGGRLNPGGETNEEN